MGTISVNGQIINGGFVIVTSIITLLIVLAWYLLRSIGLYVLAKKNGIKSAGIAFIPGVWMYTACKVIGKTRFFGTTFEKIAIWAALVFSIATYISFFTDFIGYFPYIGYYLSSAESSIDFVSTAEGVSIVTGSNFYNPFATEGVIVALRIISAFGYILNLAEIFITVTVYINLFRKFWPEHYILAAVLSFLGLFPIFVFVIRNRKPVDYVQYIRNRYYGAGYTPYGNAGGAPYGDNYSNNGGYGNNYGNEYGNDHGNNAGDQEPFGEFSNRPEEPFGEFSGDKKNDDK